MRCLCPRAPNPGQNLLKFAVAAAILLLAAGVARAEADLRGTQIISPIAGRVLKIHARPGERIGELGLAEIGDTAAMHAVAEVYERDVPRVRIGQPAKVKVQSLPGELPGQVLHVGWKIGRRVVLDNDPVKDTDARVVEVWIELDSASSQRVAGLSYARVEVRIDAPPLAGEP
ncbi:MAG: efflux RND transporter periplasmic adaptor subunit [Pirellulaceae bacterium]|nr:efflux RND transporter periplasmic adaptor subunit [Pirellulaceae bacterium]